MKDIQRVAVLGSGVMGSGIAAHLANCGIPSLMLDIVPPSLSEEDKRDPAKRSQIAAKSKQALRKTKPAPLYLPEAADLIETGNFEDDLPRVAECEWVVEVVKEDLAIKQALYAEVAKHVKPGTIVSSNTSGIQIAAMAEGLPEDLRTHFLGTHFFNPARYLPLLELIPGPDTKPEVLDFMADFCRRTLGKGVVHAKDTPNFVANRILTFASQYIFHRFREYGLTIEDVDALTGENVGHASSATFRTADLVGLDTYVSVVGNVYRNCPDDEMRDYFKGPDWLDAMVEKGLLGDKSGSGFYKKTRERDAKGKAIIHSLDLDSFDYTPQAKSRFDCIGAARQADSLADKLNAMYKGEDKGSEFVWDVFAHTAAYAANRIPEIADDIANIDNAAKWGFNWSVGLFETCDMLGVPYVVERMEKDGIAVPDLFKTLLDTGHETFYTVRDGVRHYFDSASKSHKPVEADQGVVTLTTVKQSRGVVKENPSCSLVDLGDGILCAEFHTKMNTIDPFMVEMLHEGLALLEAGEFEGMVLGNQAPHFCAGANLFLVMSEIQQGHWDNVEKAIRGLQGVNMAMRFSKRPVVAAPHHFTLGGGLEITQHCAGAVVAAETYGGLVEVGVGIIPAGGGTKEMLRRALAFVPSNIVDGDPFPYVRRAFENIAMAKVSTSGPELMALGYLTDDTPVCVPPFEQLARAKALCRGLVVAGYTPPRPARLTALGEPARAAFRTGVYHLRVAGYASEHDAIIAEKLAHALTGGDRAPGTPMTEQDVLDLECEAMLSLCGTEKTQKRMEHMLSTGKPLRN